MTSDSKKSADSDIIHQVINGNINAFELLLERYQDLVLKIVKKHTPYDQAEEIVQDVFIRAYQSLPTFRGKSTFKQWLSSVAVKTCYDFWRKRYRSRELPMSSLSEAHQNWLEGVISNQSMAEFNQQSSQQEAREVLDWALERLSAQDRMVIELVYLEGLSVKEAAELLGWSTANVKIRSFRARKVLQKLLEELIDNGR
jgi:RNA polymerase sigma-70 factor (ECF subfamily)